MEDVPFFGSEVHSEARLGLLDMMRSTRAIFWLGIAAQTTRSTPFVRKIESLCRKDADFVPSFLLKGQPHKLLLISTGNMHNRELLRLFRERVHRLAELFDEVSYVEMTRDH